MDCKDNERFLYLTKKCVSEKEYFNILFKRIKTALKEHVYSKFDYKKTIYFVIDKDNYKYFDKKTIDIFISILKDIFKNTKIEFIDKKSKNNEKDNNSKEENDNVVNVLFFNSNVLSVFLLKFLSSNVDSEENLFYKKFFDKKYFFPFIYLYDFEVEDIVVKFYDETFVFKVLFSYSEKKIFEHIKVLEKTHRDVFSSLSKSFYKLSKIIE